MLNLETILAALSSLAVRTPELLSVFKAAATTLHPDASAAGHAAIEAAFAQDDANDDALQARLAAAAQR